MTLRDYTHVPFSAVPFFEIRSGLISLQRLSMGQGRDGKGAAAEMVRKVRDRGSATAARGAGGLLG